MNVSSFRSRMKSGEKAFGPILTLPSWQVAQLAAAQEGINFLWIDGEHGMMTPEVVGAMINAGKCDATPLVRIPDSQTWMVKQALDLGARGLIVPMVETPEEAEKIADSMLYPPDGIRGYGPDYAARSWGLSCGEYSTVANEDVFFVAQIESKLGLENAEAIAAVPRVDLLFAGAYDLSIVRGRTGEVTHPDVEEAILAVRDAAHKEGKLAGTIALTPDVGLDQGFDFLVTATDQVLLEQSFVRYMAGVKVPIPELSPQ
ncbi:MAG: hypothetical protein KC994_03590 [Candidatus Omnitrophica bacterium]|nr:hypothetical protein [Candidatus Omnitrophota bacterium]